MKTLLLLLFLTSAATSQTDEYARRGLMLGVTPSSPKPIVSELHLKDLPIGNDQFELAYKSFLESRPNFGKSKLTVLQTLEEGKFLVENIGGGSSVLVYPGHTAADGSHLSVFTKPTGQIYDFTTVLGARRRLNVIELKPDGFSREEFIQIIQNGVTFSITRTAELAPCKDCFGAGRVPIKTGKRTGDGKAVCQTCRGAGKTAQTYQKKVSW